MKNHLEVTISDHNSFCTLYADGNHAWKTYDRQKKHTLIYYPPEAVVFLYYTYVTYREACVIRNVQDDNGAALRDFQKKLKYCSASVLPALTS